MSKPGVDQINQQELSALIERVEYAIAHDLALSVEDMKLLLQAISTLCQLQQKMEENSVTVYKLRKLLGMVQQSEKNRRKKSTHSKKSDKETEQPFGSSHKSKNNKLKRKPTVVNHKLAEQKKGDVCPACNRGKLYPFKSGRLLRITGHAPYEAQLHLSERLRCNACGQLFTADLPEDVLNDGDSDQMYGYSARSLMVLSKMYSGQPYHHQSGLAALFGETISAATIYKQCEFLADDIMPVFYQLKNLASSAVSYLLDDTHHRILSAKPELRDKRKGKGQQLRSGVYSSGLIALTESGQELVLFETSLGHAGELLDSLLAKRPADLPKALMMSDALSSNNPILTDKVISTYCNAHCRRQFFDLAVIDESLSDWFIDTYDKIWLHERYIKQQGFDVKQRLSYHREHSLPVMESLRDWALNYQQSADYEAHGTIGKAVNYLLRHFDKLTQFCRVAGALIDNNRMEQTLKLIIRGRKLAYFYRSQVGADVANVLLSIIATAHRADANLYDYLLQLQRHKQAVKAHPELWMPWNYLVQTGGENAEQAA